MCMLYSRVIGPWLFNMEFLIIVYTGSETFIFGFLYLTDWAYCHINVYIVTVFLLSLWSLLLSFVNILTLFHFVLYRMYYIIHIYIKVFRRKFQKFLNIVINQSFTCSNVFFGEIFNALTRLIIYMNVYAWEIETNQRCIYCNIGQKNITSVRDLFAARMFQYTFCQWNSSELHIYVILCVFTTSYVIETDASQRNVCSHGVCCTYCVREIDMI